MKLGLALGGGGAKGFAHLGVLEVLGDAGIEFDVVAGTSIGSLIGAAYASDSMEKLHKIANDINLLDIPLLLGPTWPSKGFFSGARVLRILDQCVSVKNIEELKKPYAAVAVDLNSAETVTFTKGELRTAVRASISIPGVFKPVEFEGKLLVDGGILEPLPVAAVKSLGADLVVACDLLSNLEGSKHYEQKSRSSFYDYLRTFSEKLYVEKWFEGKDNGGSEKSIVSIIQRSSVTAQRKLTEYNSIANPADLVISPPVANVGVMDFHRGQSIIEIGRREAERALPKLKRLLKQH